jgi:cold shock CspA family protein
MKKGTVTFKSKEKGYGFIMSETDERFFFHITQIGHENFEQLTKGDSVTFENTETPRGMQVTSILANPIFIQNTNHFKKTINFSEEQIRELFGDLAAEDENIDRFNSYFIKTDTYEKIHNSLPIRILVAHKGIGKSAIFRMSYIENQNSNVLSLWVKPNDISNLGKVEGPIDSLELIRQWHSGLDELIINKIISNFNLNSENSFINQVANKGIKLADRIATIVKKVPEVVNIDFTKKQVAEQYMKENKIIILLTI